MNSCLPACSESKIVRLIHLTCQGPESAGVVRPGLDDRQALDEVLLTIAILWLKVGVPGKQFPWNEVLFKQGVQCPGDCCFDQGVAVKAGCRWR